MMTFREYLMTRKITDNPTGDFIEDSRNIPEVADATTWDEVYWRLRRRSTPETRDEVLRCGRRVWLAYQKKIGVTTA